MQLTRQFQGQMVKAQGYRRAGAYRVGQTQRPHCWLLLHWSIKIIKMRHFSILHCLQM